MSQNPFLTAVQQYDTYTENGAVSHSTSGNALLDYFAKAGTFRDRKLSDVFADMGKIWGESPFIATQIVFYLRMVTRNTKGFLETSEVQRGQGVRDEYRKAIHWLAKFHPNQLYPNLWLMPLAGAWKDLWHEDLLGVLRQEAVFELIQRGLNDEYNSALIAKYLPKIRSKSQVFNPRHKKLNDFALALCAHLGWTQKEYRQFKASGAAHNFQRLMSEGLWDKINFNAISGKALFQMANHRGKDGKTTIERHNMETRYMDWLATQPTVKFTGYVYELYKSIAPKMSAAQKFTLDKQFDGLIELAKKGDNGIKENVWCALDTSGSMTTSVAGNVTAFDICVSLGLYFSALNEGSFHNNVIMFDNVSRVLQLKGESFTDKAAQIKSATTAWGGTNFQSVIDEIVRIRKTNPNIALEHYPTTLLVVSDMQFNPVKGSQETNYKNAMKELAKVGLPKMRIIWWWVTGRKKDFPSTASDEGVTMIGGFDGAIITQIVGGQQTVVDKATGQVRQLNAYENMLKALDQELLQQIKV
jgi:hypothetical protein